MNIGTVNNAFWFSLPNDFVPDHLEERYMPALKAWRKPYSSVADYVNSTIQSIDFPSMTVPTVTQINKFGKEIYWKGNQNVYDNFSRKGTITFSSVDYNFNYMIILNCIKDSYVDVNNFYSTNLIMTMIDENRKAVFHTQYRDVIFTGIDGTTFGFNTASQESRTFNVEFVYNFMDIEFLYDQQDIIQNEKIGLLNPPQNSR